MKSSPSDILSPLLKTDEQFGGRKGSKAEAEGDQEGHHKLTVDRVRKFGLGEPRSKNDMKIGLLWALLASYLPEDVQSLEKNFVHHVEYTLARHRTNLDHAGAFKALALSVKDRLVERWKDTQSYFHESGCKRVAYLSLEFLLGRSLQNSIHNLGLENNFSEAMRNLGFNLEELYEEERDAGLGNGGLGRLAACFLDSLATLDLPAWGYGLRYQYGMFHQEISDGEQKEFPDFWLMHGNPWEVERLDVIYVVKFGGRVVQQDGASTWVDTENVLAVAYDTPIPGYNTFNTLNIRLWSAKPSQEFDLAQFNDGDFFGSIEARQKAERITQVLYPNDNTPEGKELRLRQQYFFVSATLQDLIRRFKKENLPIQQFPDKVAIQLNDTHPALAVVELLRYLLDYEEMNWDEAWGLVERTFAYTNHTVLPEALEKWPVPMLEKLLPRHLLIIYQINHHWLVRVGERWPGDVEKMRSMSIIEEGFPKNVRMANLAMVASHSVNGVAAIHSRILVERIFPDFHAMFPEKFNNKTNGVTPRRWVAQANPELARLISTWLGGDDSWLVDWTKLEALKAHAGNPKLHALWRQVKTFAKQGLQKHVAKRCGVFVPEHFLYDVQVKRIHEYKRQLMNVIWVIHRYQWIKSLSPGDRQKLVVPRGIFIGGKAAPGYFMAKQIIKLINYVANVINNDQQVNDYLKLVFIPNYCVSLAETIIPGSDLSQHISTAGMEASGTSNMKFAMNGCLILGTLDGANVEIRDAIGPENMFIFGTKAEDVETQRHKVRMQSETLDPRYVKVLQLLKTDAFGHPDNWASLLSSLEHGNDFYLVGTDFAEYCDAQDEVDAAYTDQQRWVRSSIISTACSGSFSSDRTIGEYARDIWGIEPMRRPGPQPVPVSRLQEDHLVPEDISASYLGVSPPRLDMPTVMVERMTPVQAPKYRSQPTTVDTGFDAPVAGDDCFFLKTWNVMIRLPPPTKAICGELESYHGLFL